MYISFLVLSYLYLAVVKAVNYCQRLNSHAGVAQIFAAVLKGLFYDETHACKRCSGLVYEVYYAFGSIAVGQKVVSKAVLTLQIFLC